MQRTNIIRDPKVIQQWLATLTIAASCCWYPGCLRLEVDVNHIIGGHGRRSDEPANLSLLCRWVHHPAFHGERVIVDGKVQPRVTLGQVLQMKKTLDPAAWNPERLAELRGQALPELEAA
jgi:hypothetical protein